MNFQIAFLFFIFSGQAQAFTLVSPDNSNMKGWNNPSISLVVNLSNCPPHIDVVGIIKDAAKIWNNVPTSRVSVSYEGPTTLSQISSPTVVYCEGNFQAVVGADQNYVPGAALADYMSGEITQGVLYLNVSAGTGNIANFDRDKLVIILAHEIGHIIGLGHSDSTASLMYYDASAKEHLALSQDDIDGVSYLYPRDEMAEDKMMGCGLVKNLPPPSGHSKWIYAMLLLPMIFGLLLRSQKLRLFK